MGFGLDSMSSGDGACNEVVVKLSVEKTVNFSRSCGSSSHIEALSAKSLPSRDFITRRQKISKLLYWLLDFFFWACETASHNKSLEARK